MESIDEELPPSRPVTPETAKAISVILSKAPPANTEMPSTITLPEELSAPTGGEDYALSLIGLDRIAGRIGRSRRNSFISSSVIEAPKQGPRPLHLGQSLVHGVGEGMPSSIPFGARFTSRDQAMDRLRLGRLTKKG